MRPTRVSRRAPPALLIVIGTLLLIGCLPIPSLRQSQPDGTPRPEHDVGRGSDKPVQIGRTRIDDAFMALSRRVRSGYTMDPWHGGGHVANVPVLWSIGRWRVSPDRRHFALQYQVSKGWLVWPLCFTAWQDTAERWLTLDVSPDGTITGSRTTDKPPGPATPIGEWLEVFDPPTRQKLRDAGVFPPDDAIVDAQQHMDRALARARATTLPATTQGSR
jgi:hypothetical protein